jgi:hypothetical protein
LARRAARRGVDQCILRLDREIRFRARLGRGSDGVGFPSEDGERLPPDIQDIPRYAVVKRAEDREPGMKGCYPVRGRMRLKFYCSEGDDEVLKLLRHAMRAGVSESAMHHAVDDNTSLEDCFVAMGVDRTAFRIAMRHPIVDLRPKGQQVFLR